MGNNRLSWWINEAYFLVGDNYKNKRDAWIVTKYSPQGIYVGVYWLYFKNIEDYIKYGGGFIIKKDSKDWKMYKRKFGF